MALRPGVLANLAVNGLKPDELSRLKKILEDVSYLCGATFNDLELPGCLVNICIKDHRCTDPIEKYTTHAILRIYVFTVDKKTICRLMMITSHSVKKSK